MTMTALFVSLVFSIRLGQRYTKIVKHIKYCCCTSHCLMTGHAKSDVSLNTNVVPAMENLLDRSWTEYGSLEEDVFENLPVVEDKFMSYSCAVLDLEFESM